MHARPDCGSRHGALNGHGACGYLSGVFCGPIFYVRVFYVQTLLLQGHLGAADGGGSRLNNVSRLVVWRGREGGPVGGRLGRDALP